ncbi:MAG: beta-hexosaminidase [Calditrichaeota bacterium]|nr:MAG: beta-hexosaminidase [Calditrichota bacterium]
MKQHIIYYLWIFLMAISQLSATEKAAATTLYLMPVPTKITHSAGEFRLHADFQIQVTGAPDERIYPAATRMLRRLSGRTGLFFPQDFITAADNAKNADLKINCKRPGKVELGENETYVLTITPEHINLNAETDIGALRGLETLLQLLSADANGYYFPCVTIEDEPRFAWRGLLIDVGRHFMPVHVIKRNLDGMAAVKMNVLHWHLTEDQGFRVESKIYPKLHQLGSDGFYYTQEHIRGVIKYAADRGIRVVPEFDVPGHATSWLVGYPKLGSKPGPYEIIRKWGIQYAALDPTNENVYAFLDQFFGEMAALFPDPYFHIGGDEVEQGKHHKAEHWNANPGIQAFMKKNNIADNAALQAWFNSKLVKILTKHQKIMIGWEEILHESMPRSIVIQSWRGAEAMVSAARAGFQSILSRGYYIDLIQPTDFHYLNDPLPPDISLNAEQKNLILGGEATMWSELVTPENIDSRIWPRTAAIAERLWSPQHVKDVDDMYRRLQSVSMQLEELGLTHEKNYEMMLRRLAGSANIHALRTFVDLVEPVKRYKRHSLNKNLTSFAPMTRVVDTARPDAQVARIFRKNVSAYLNAGNKTIAERLQADLKLWNENHDELSMIIERSPVLAEIEPMSKTLTQCAEIGLQSLSALRDKRTLDKNSIANAKRVLAQAKKPVAEVELMVVSGIEDLLEAAGK